MTQWEDAAQCGEATGYESPVHERMTGRKNSLCGGVPVVALGGGKAEGAGYAPFYEDFLVRDIGVRSGIFHIGIFSAPFFHGKQHGQGSGFRHEAVPI